MAQREKKTPERPDEEAQRDAREAEHEARRTMKEIVGEALRKRTETKSIMDVEGEMQGDKTKDAALEGEERASKMAEKRFTMKEPQRTGRTEGSAR